MKEADVTRVLKDFLSSHSWVILSIHYPGSQVGMYIHSETRAEKGAKGSIVLDLVARKDEIFLLVESKTTFSQKDVWKLITLTEYPYYSSDLKRKLNLTRYKNPRLLRAVAVHNVKPENAKIPANFLLFKIAEGKVTVFGTFVNPSDKNIFSDYTSFY